MPNRIWQEGNCTKLITKDMLWQFSRLMIKPCMITLTGQFLIAFSVNGQNNQANINPQATPLNQEHLITIPSVYSDSVARQQFDFVLGSWELWAEGKKVGKATFSKILEDHAIEQLEIYNGGGSSKALISYATHNKHWVQSWVDVWGYHLTSKGGIEAGKLTLYLSEPYYESKVNSQVIARRIFMEVSKDRFDYFWEISQDDGKTWTLDNSTIYKRISH